MSEPTGDQPTNAFGDQPTNAFGVYVHIPFCAKRCDYCAFATWTDRDHLIEQYVAACKTEIAGADLQPASSVFFGGGTPSLIAPELLASILEDIPLQPGAEVTVECNPDTVSLHLFKVYRAAGVNRISLGVQSMVPHVLRALGRTHDIANVAEAVRLAAEAGIERVNVDLIYGAKGESIDDWQASLDAIALLQPVPTHISAYGLTVEAGTPLADDPARYPDDDDQADKYLMAEAAFSALGLANYEVSNWATPGNESRHNYLYWRQQNYRGIGCSAHSHKDGHRWWNIRTPDRYIKQVEAGVSTMAADEHLDEATRAFEKLELELRTREGVPAETVPFEELGNLVRQEGDRGVLTVDGRLMANAVAVRLRVKGELPS